jgi:hypothetical protein
VKWRPDFVFRIAGSSAVTPSSESLLAALQQALLAELRARLQLDVKMHLGMYRVHAYECQTCTGLECTGKSPWALRTAQPCFKWSHGYNSTPFA